MPNMPAKTDLTGSGTQGQFKIAFNQMYDFIVEKLGSVAGVLKANQVNADATGGLIAGTVASQLAALESGKINSAAKNQQNINLNSVTVSGTYYVSSTCSNTPEAVSGYMTVAAESANYIMQTYVTENQKKVYMRTCVGGTWGAWMQKDVASAIAASAAGTLLAGTVATQLAALESKSTFSANVLPQSDNALLLGSPSLRWSQIWASNGTIQTSDSRAKTDIAESALGLNFISKLRPVSYKFKVGENIVTQEPDGEEEVITQEEIRDADGNITQKRIVEMRPKVKTVITPRAGVRTHYGLIAQEVKEALGNVDFGGHVYDQESDSHGLRYEEFVSVLIKAVQELSKEVETLKAQIAK